MDNFSPSRRNTKRRQLPELRSPDRGELVTAGGCERLGAAALGSPPGAASADRLPLILCAPDENEGYKANSHRPGGARTQNTGGVYGGPRLVEQQGLPTLRTAREPAHNRKSYCLLLRFIVFQGVVQMSSITAIFTEF